ncbi:MAG TPA: flagellar hook-associated protein 3, partial [Ruminococcaceae bacterium]|nr:flagellar hook-associated protein 3 [Oscillospiraceae bacterium]HBT91861.1 flagellar hook-associated protein 3 [Oscillospiraceae bacterium]
ATGQSAFDSAMPGIRYVGYGTDENGVPKNVFSLLKDIEGYLKDDSASVSELVEKLNPYRDALQSAEDTFISSKTDIGARGNFLEETDSYLEAIGENLSEKDNQVEYVDFEDAITSFSTQQYCYLASLQVGSKVLQTSLMDYLR